MAQPPPPSEPPWEYEEGSGNWSEALCAGEAAAADWEASFALLPALYLLVFALGLSGNGLVLATVWRGPRAKRRAADAYLAHLALADLAFVVTLPLWAAYTALRFHWPFGAALCKLSSYLVLLNMFASAFCLAGLSVERYLAIVRALPRPAGPPAAPPPCPRARARAPAPLALGAVWLLAALLALPALLLRDTRPGGADGASLRCDLALGGGGEEEGAEEEEAEARWLAALSLGTTALGFALPLLLMALCYCRLGAALRRHFRAQPAARREEGRQRRRLLRLLVALVAVFAACWLPFHLLKSLYVLHGLALLPLPCAGLALLVRLHPYAACLAYLNSCLNPLLYAFFDGRARARARRLLGLRGARRRRHRPPAGSGSVSSTLSAQTQKSEAPSLGTKV